MVDISDARTRKNLPFWVSPMCRRVELREEYDDDGGPTGKRIPIVVVSQTIAKTRKERHTKGVRWDIDATDLFMLSKTEVERLVAYKTRICLETLGIIKQHAGRAGEQEAQHPA